LISGDLYEHRYITRKTLDWLNMVLSELKTPVVIIPGNHDPYVLNSWYKAWEWPSNVFILSPEHPRLLLDKEQVNIYGIGFSSFKEEKPDLSNVPPPEQGYFNILMFHGTLDMNFTGQAYNPVTSQELEGLGYDYYALGHFHGTRADYRLKNAVNPGSPEPLGFDEPGVHGAFSITLAEENGEKTFEARRFETAARIYQDKKLDVSGLKTLEEVKFRILALLEGLDPKRDITRITLKGRTDLQIDLDELTGLLSGDWFYLKITDETKKAFDMEDLAKDPSLKGAFAREIQERLLKLEPELEKNPLDEGLLMQKKRLEIALSFGLEALINGKIEWWGILQE
jgi:DNA repair exonuclease SbcCD nuclease subunit